MHVVNRGAVRPAALVIRFHHVDPALVKRPLQKRDVIVAQRLQALFHKAERIFVLQLQIDVFHDGNVHIVHIHLG